MQSRYTSKVPSWEQNSKIVKIEILYFFFDRTIETSIKREISSRPYVPYNTSEKSLGHSVFNAPSLIPLRQVEQAELALTCFQSRA